MNKEVAAMSAEGRKEYEKEKEYFRKLREKRQKYATIFKFPHLEEWTKYDKVAKIGQGTFGEVFKARDKKNNSKFVALKRVLMDNDEQYGFPMSALREMKILQQLKHENILHLIELCRIKPERDSNYLWGLCMVLDFCEHDLAGLLANTQVRFNLGEIKKVMQQLLNGLYYIHKNKIFHRDIKPANVLITKTGILKLADFGLSRAFNDKQPHKNNCYTEKVVTLWYRPPELLLGARDYGPAVDLWGAGCIMAEMWTRTPIMLGETEQHQLILISHLCGSITTEIWPGVENLELFNIMELPKGQKRKVKERLKPYVKDPYACDLLDKLLFLDPAKRFDSETALNHSFFWDDPMPRDLGKMLVHHNRSMFEYLARPRKPNEIRIPQHNIAEGSTKLSADTGYQHRVF